MPEELIENFNEKEALKNLRSHDESPEKHIKGIPVPVQNNMIKFGGTLGTISEKKALEEEMSSSSMS